MGEGEGLAYVFDNGPAAATLTPLWLCGKRREGVFGMANIKGAIKRSRQAVKRNASNVSAKTALKSKRRKLFAALESKTQELSVQEYRAYCSMLDKLAKRGIIKRNTAIRRKARAAARVRKLAAK